MESVQPVSIERERRTDQNGNDAFEDAKTNGHLHRDWARRNLVREHVACNVGSVTNEYQAKLGLKSAGACLHSKWSSRSLCTTTHA